MVCWKQIPTKRGSGTGDGAARRCGRSPAMPRLQVLIWFLLPLFALLALLTFAGWVSGAIAAILFVVLAALVIIVAAVATRQRAQG